MKPVQGKVQGCFVATISAIVNVGSFIEAYLFVAAALALSTLVAAALGGRRASDGW